MKGERTDRLRRRPEMVRYYYLAVSRTTLHTGLSYGGLDYVRKNHGIVELHVSDLLNGKVVKVTEPPEDFMKRWRNNYNNPEWDYEAELKAGVLVSSED